MNELSVGSPLFRQAWPRQRESSKIEKVVARQNAKLREREVAEKGLCRPGAFQFRLGKAFLPGTPGYSRVCLAEAPRKVLSAIPHHSIGEDVGHLQCHPCI